MPSLGSTPFVDIFSSPQLVFDRIRAKSLPFWPPLLVVIAVLPAFLAWYFMTVDMSAYMETTLVLADQEMTPEAFDAAMATANIVRIISPIAAPLISLFSYLILATFFFLAATLVAEEKFRFGQFFTLVCWASLPGLLSTLSMAVSYAASPDYVFLNQLDKTNLASLALSNSPHFGHLARSRLFLSMNGPWYLHMGQLNLSLDLKLTSLNSGALSPLRKYSTSLNFPSL